MGASFSNSSTSKVPSEVSNTSMGQGASWPFAFGDALVAGEIAVRGYVSEAARDKRGTHGSGLGRTVLEHEPPAGAQVPGRGIDQRDEGPKAISARGQCAARLEHHAIAAQRRIVGGDVRRVARDRVEMPTCQRREPVSGQP